MMYDVIVIGSGSAGAVIAERVSAGTPGHQPSVLLLEAGIDWGNRPYDASGLPGGQPPTDPALARKTSVRANVTQDTTADHEYWPYLDQTGLLHDYAKQVGGSSSHNGMMSFTGTRLDYASWPDGWQFDDLQPYFAAVIERMNIRPRPRLTMDAGARAFELSARALGIPGVETLGADFNDAYARSGLHGRSAFSSAVGPTTANIRGMVGNNNLSAVDKYGGRQGALETYIEDLRERPNVTLQPLAWARTINFAQTGNGQYRASSVTYVDQRPNGQGEVTVEGKLIVSCANVLGTPGLLMRSNIGPTANPGSTNRFVRLQHVGQHYNNQPGVIVGAVYNRDIHPQFGYSGPITVNKEYDKPGKAIAMVVLNHANPDIGALLTEWGQGFKDQMRSWRRMQFGFAFLPYPTSEGTITLDESKPNSVNLTFNLSGQDARLMQAGADEMRAIWEGINGLNLTGDLAGLRVVKTFQTIGYMTASHAIATCRMGQRADDSVVDARTLRVHGFENLMVVDGSIFPGQVQSPHLPILAVALKAANTLIRPQLGLA